MSPSRAGDRGAAHARRVVASGALAAADAYLDGIAVHRVRRLERPIPLGFRAPPSFCYLRGEDPRHARVLRGAGLLD